MAYTGYIAGFMIFRGMIWVSSLLSPFKERFFSFLKFIHMFLARKKKFIYFIIFTYKHL